MMSGFVERLKDDLDGAYPRDWASMRASVIPHPTIREPGYNYQRKYAAWIGGSMLASLSPFKQACCRAGKRVQFTLPERRCFGKGRREEKPHTTVNSSITNQH